jgi:plasmid stabilization system protein ParE
VKIKFLKLAKLEFDEAIKYYEHESIKLGARFKKEIRASIDMIVQFPELYPIAKGDIRRCVTHTFPYTIYYVYKNESIFIYAIANHFKEPNQYIKRFK